MKHLTTTSHAVLLVVFVVAVCSFGCKSTSKLPDGAGQSPSVPPPTEWNGYVFGKTYEELSNKINADFFYLGGPVVLAPSGKQDNAWVLIGYWKRGSDQFTNVWLQFDKSPKALIQVSYEALGIDSISLLNIFVQRYGPPSMRAVDKYFGYEAAIWQWTDPYFKIALRGRNVRYVWRRDYTEYSPNYDAKKY